MRPGLCLLLLWSVCFWSSESKATAAPKVSCRDENNLDVEWYILYKAPKGQEYIYISTNGKKPTKINIGASNGVLANTLRPMFNQKMPDSFGFLSYNDQLPTRFQIKSQNDTSDSDRSAQYGHSKGVVLGDSKTKTALWLTHSTPRFPRTKKPATFWPKTGEKNGQTFMCVTLEFKMLGVIGTHLQNIQAHTFDKRIPVSFPQEMEEAGNNNGQAPHTKPLVQILSSSKPKLKAVAKVTGNNASAGDLYVQLSRIFKSDMDVKPWGCQSGRDKSYCEPNQHKVMNVIKVKTDLGEWKWTNDHSKWAITTNQNVHSWTCIADMNRAKSQYERPGGALCIQGKKVNDLFTGFVTERLQCGVTPRKRSLDCDDKAYEDSLADDLQEMDLSDDEEPLTDDLQEEDLSDDEEPLTDDLQEEDESITDDPNKHEEL